MREHGRELAIPASMHSTGADRSGIESGGGVRQAPRRSQPAASRPAWRRSPAFAFFCAYALFVVYGTLLPFQFITDPALLHDRWNWINWNPLVLVTGVATPIADIVVNLAFFMPLGFIGFHAQRRRSAASAILRSMIAGLVLSITVEAMQYFTPSRNPATSDVLTNMAGALAGAMLAALFRRELEGALTRRVAAWTAREPLLPVLVGYAAVVSVAALVPFDFGCSVSALRHALHVAQLQLAGTPAQWTSALVNGLRFAVLAGLALHVVARIHRGSRPAQAFLCALVGGVLAIGLEVGQLLVRSHVFATRDLVAGVAGSAVGALVGLALEGTGRSGWGWGLVAVVYAIGIVAEALVPFGFRFDLDSMLSRVTYTALIPYSSYYFKANVAAVADLLDGLLTWLPFAFVLARLRSDGRRPDLRAGLTAITWCAVLALAVELMQFGVPRRYPEISDVLTAALGAALGAYAWSWCAHLAADQVAPRCAASSAGSESAPPREVALRTETPALASAVPTSQASS
jgi:glycopeptide antibiotics resistance protein